MFKKNVLYFFFTITIFFIDRLSKYWAIKNLNNEDQFQIILSPYLSLDLIWNKGIAFGLFSFNADYIYNVLTILIIIVILIIIGMIVKSQGFRKYLLLAILGGSLGNVFDRIYYTAVPDFIDFHINEFHWFVFNIADIFISLGVIGLIFVEIIYSIKENEKN